MTYLQDGGTASAPRRPCGRSAFAAALALALAGCATGDGVGVVFADPAKYNAYHCDDMVAEWKSLRSREKELANLISRASVGTGGTVIGALAYRSDYETVMTEQRMLQRAAVAKKCELEARRQSDDGIR
jgi:hypothetical protein